MECRSEIHRGGAETRRIDLAIRLNWIFVRKPKAAILMLASSGPSFALDSQTHLALKFRMNSNCGMGLISHPPRLCASAVNWPINPC